MTDPDFDKEFVRWLRTPGEKAGAVHARAIAEYFFSAGRSSEMRSRKPYDSCLLDAILLEVGTERAISIFKKAQLDTFLADNQLEPILPKPLPTGAETGTDEG